MDSEDEDEVQYCICRSTDATRFMICCDNCEEWYHGDCIDVTQKQAKNIKIFYCDGCRGHDPTLVIKYKLKKTKKYIEPERETRVAPSTKHIPIDNLDPIEIEPTDRQTRSAANRKKSTRRCGECVACSRKVDCGRCDFCKDMKKFGGPNRIRQKCRLRQCINFGARFTPTVLADEGLFDDEKNEGLILSGHKFSEKPSKKEKFEISSATDSETADYIPDATHFEDEDHVLYDINRKSPKGSRRSDDKYQSPKKRTKTHRSKKTKEQKPKHSSRKHAEFEELERSFLEEEDDEKQCYGPGCINTARKGSKYCSDQCGLKLATNRIYEILPQRIQQWNSSPCIAEDNNKRELEKIRRQQLDARQKLGELDLKHQELDALIERAKHATLLPEQENNDESEEAELSIYCVTCGHEINQKGALKHMEKCFIKYESQTSFGSIYKTRIEGNSMFCDYYNSQQKTYCKRLKVLCPEHSKEAKVREDEVCGCPLVTNVFEETGEFCRNAKRKCARHFCWEKLRRAEIDMERVRQWIKLDELFEQERNIRMAMANRAGVLGLVLNQTIDHDPLNPIKTPEPISI